MGARSPVVRDDAAVLSRTTGDLRPGGPNITGADGVQRRARLAHR